MCRGGKKNLNYKLGLTYETPSLVSSFIPVIREKKKKDLRTNKSHADL